MKALLAILVGFISIAARAQTSSDTIWMADSPVVIQQRHCDSNSGIFFIHLHTNETTSLLITEKFLDSSAGCLLQLEHDTTRLVTFYLKATRISLDPNRIFTTAGRRKNLRLLNGNYPAAAEGFATRLSEAIMAKMSGRARLIIAMHNNTDGLPLSVKSFKQRYVNPAMDADDFILTTSKKIFDQLKAKKINAVWQTTATSPDDGSLAIYCDQHHIPYINIEAQQGHEEQQLQMLRDIQDIIEKYSRQ